MNEYIYTLRNTNNKSERGPFKIRHYQTLCAALIVVLLLSVLVKTSDSGPALENAGGFFSVLLFLRAFCQHCAADLD